MECDSHCFAALSLFMKMLFSKSGLKNQCHGMSIEPTTIPRRPCSLCESNFLRHYLLLLLSSCACRFAINSTNLLFPAEAMTRKRLEISPEIKSFFFSQERWTMSTGHGSEKLLLSAVPTPVSSFHLVKFLFPFVFDACLQN